jgi:serine/threonine protein phosphatase PrpC
LDWFKVSGGDRESPYHRDLGSNGFDDTSHNKDAERRRKLDRGKSCGSWSTLSSTSSITTVANTAGSLHVETEDDEASQIDPRRRRMNMMDHDIDDQHLQEGVLIGTPPGCEGHYFYPQDAMLYTAHVGDCRAVMLGSAPPRTIKVPPDGDSLGLDHADISEDESCSETVADEISSSEHDSDSSGDDTMLEDDDHFVAATTGANGLGRTRALGFVRRTSKRQRRNEIPASEEPFVPLPPLNLHDSSSEESVVESDAIESDDSASTTSLVVGRPSLVFNNLSEEEKMSETEDEDELKEIRSVRSGSPTQMDRLPSPTQLVSDVVVHPSPLPLSLLMRPIDLTTDHSAYNPAEVAAVLRRCNNAPKAISSASSGGIKRVAGSLAVTRALGDAYLKTPRLSFFPYKRHAPYITARPEVNCRILTKGADRILTLASDGVWERASGDDVLRWVRNYYNSRIVEMTEQHLYDAEDEQHHVYDNPTILKRLTNEEESLASGVVGGDTTKVVVVNSSIADKDQKFNEGDATGFILSGDDKLRDSDATSTFHASPTMITANESTTPPPVTVIKRKHSEIASTEDDSVSSHLDSSIAGVELSNPTSRRRLRSFSTPNVADVIVRKVLSKVSKSRNTSLRMLRSLPKGRARRSKHDDITATVVDLSVSIVTRYYYLSSMKDAKRTHTLMFTFVIPPSIIQGFIS